MDTNQTESPIQSEKFLKFLTLTEGPIRASVTVVVVATALLLGKIDLLVDDLPIWIKDLPTTVLRVILVFAVIGYGVPNGMVHVCLRARNGDQEGVPGYKAVRDARKAVDNKVRQGSTKLKPDAHRRHLVSLLPAELREPVEDHFLRPFAAFHTVIGSMFYVMGVKEPRVLMLTTPEDDKFLDESENVADEGGGLVFDAYRQDIRAVISVHGASKHLLRNRLSKAFGFVYWSLLVFTVAYAYFDVVSAACLTHVLLGINRGRYQLRSAPPELLMMRLARPVWSIGAGLVLLVAAQGQKYGPLVFMVEWSVITVVVAVMAAPFIACHRRPIADQTVLRFTRASSVIMLALVALALTVEIFVPQIPVILRVFDGLLAAGALLAAVCVAMCFKERQPPPPKQGRSRTPKKPKAKV